MLQVRVDDYTKKRASQVFNALGIDLSTAVRVFLFKSITVGGFPFEMTVTENELKAFQALEDAHKISKELGNDKMSLKEINKIIKETRKESKKVTNDK